MIRFFRITVMVGAAILDCMTIYSLVPLFGKYEQRKADFMIATSIVVIMITILSLIMESVLSNFVTTGTTDEFLNTVIRWLSILSVILFFVYFFLLAISHA